MLGKIGLERKGLATVGTAEWLVGAVGLHMSSQVALVCKGLGTDVAPEWFFPSVSSNVSLQQPGPREAFTTMGTATAGPVSAQVHGQRCRTAILSPTSGAVKLLDTSGDGL
jgi:hypothetical protein